jgi:hypothetical protein
MHHASEFFLSRYLVLLLASGLWVAVTVFRRGPSYAVGASNTPGVKLTYDRWRAVPLILFLGYAFYNLVYAFGVTVFAFKKHPSSMTPAISLVVSLTGVISGMMVLFTGTCMVIGVIRVLLPDRLYIGPEGLGLYSFGRKQQWTWPQISDVQLRSYFLGRAGSVQYVVVILAGDEPRIVRIPSLLKAGSTPETAQSVYEMIKCRLPVQRTGLEAT